MEKVRWGILSTANIGLNLVIPAMQKSELCSIEGIASRNLDKAQKAAKELGISKSYGSYEELLEDDDIDAIYNPLPNHLHVPWTLKAMEAGKHVLCEKPIALTAEEAKELKAKSEKYPDVKVMEAFMYRFHPQLDKIKEIIKEERIGELRFVHSIFTYFNDNPDDIRNKPGIGGGGLMDIGCYCISIARYLFESEPHKVSGDIEKDPKFGVDRYASGMMKFPNGRSSFSCATQLSHQQSLKVFGTKGHLEVEDIFNVPVGQNGLIKLTVDDEQEQIEIPAANQYTLQGDAFSKAILNNTAVPTPLEDAVNNMKVIDAIFESGEKEEWVAIK